MSVAPPQTQRASARSAPTATSSSSACADPCNRRAIQVTVDLGGGPEADRPGSPALSDRAAGPCPGCIEPDESRRGGDAISRVGNQFSKTRDAEPAVPQALPQPIHLSLERDDALARARVVDRPARFETAMLATTRWREVQISLGVAGVHWFELMQRPAPRSFDQVSGPGVFGQFYPSAQSAGRASAGRRGHHSDWWRKP